MSTAFQSNTDEMYVTKRSGEREIVSFDKILTRIKNQGTFGSKAYPLPPLKINYTTLAMKVIDQLYDGISTSKIDELSAEQCASMASVHPDYNALAGRITVSNHQKNTSASFSEVMAALYQYVDKNGNLSPLVSRELYESVQAYAVDFDALCDYGRDYDIDYFGFKTLERAYLMKINKKTVERPQHMWLRVAIGIHIRSKNMTSDIDQYSDLAGCLVDFSDWPGTFDHIKQTYDHMSQKYFTHATPTLFNAGTPHPQLSSCFLLAMEKDSIEGIYNTLKDCALISKWAGGIGLHIHNIRATGSHIRGTNGQSNGIVPMLRVFNNTAKYVDQCVVPETLIYTDQGPIPIWKTVSGQTKVFGKTGKLETVQNVLEYSYSGEMVEIDMQPSAGEPGFNFNDLFTIFDDTKNVQPFSPSTLKITPEHPIYILRNYADETEEVIQNDLALGLAALEWTEAKNVTTEDLIVYSVPDHIQDHVELTEELCYFYGVMLNALATEKEHRLQKRTVYAFSQEQENPWLILEFNTLQYKVVEELGEFLTGRLVEYTKKVDEDITSFIIETTLNLPYRISDFFDVMGQNQTVRSPKIGQRWLFLPHYKTQCILNGLLYNQTNARVSPTLQPQIAFLNLRMGKIYNNYGLGMNTQEPAFFRYQNFLLRKVTDVSTKPYTGYVYDLQMTTEHNYLLEHGLVHNGGGKRNGSFAIYLEPWHADIEMFLQMRKNHGDEELKARDLFYALWVPDLFMERIKTDGQWTLMCPDECPGLAEVYGQDFVDLYTKYEQEGKGRKSVRARDLWFQVLDAQMETGTPYLLYKDACNKKSNQQNVGTIKSSNLCVAPETRVLTDKGHQEIQCLAGQRVKVWNGKEFSDVDVVKTGENQELISVETDDGCKIECTPYHKFFIQNSYNKNSVTVVEAKDLKSGDKLKKCSYPVIDGHSTMKYAYTHGFFCGDGTYSNVCQEQSACKFKSLDGYYYCKRHIDYETPETLSAFQSDPTSVREDQKCNAMSYEKKPMLVLYGEKKNLLEHIEHRSFTESKELVRSPLVKNGVETDEFSEHKTCIRLTLPVDLAEKYMVPVDYSIRDKMEWFSGLCDADGSIANNQDNQQLQVSSIHNNFLMEIKMMLQTCGINPKVKHMKTAGTSYLPDGKGGHKNFDTKPMYRLLITSVDLAKLVDLGFSPRRLKIHGKSVPKRDANQFIKIKSVTITGRHDTTYCFTEEKEHAGIFNGILTSQCSEIIQYSDENESAVCNLASIALPRFIKTDADDNKNFDYGKLHEVARMVTYNLNQIIDVNYYPTEKTRRSNMRHRPIGIGIQGLADVFMMMDLPFASEKSKEINKLIFETIYHGALTESCELAKKHGPYETFPGSPASKGQLQFDLWNVDPVSVRYNWSDLKRDIQANGLRNSLLLSPMPTASTSQILGYNECIEPITSNIYSRRTIAGEFIMANRYLMSDLIKLDLWNEKIKNSIIANHGSIQHIDIIPENIREKYKTVWEIPMRNLIDMAADRGAYICQSQSLNLWLEDPTYSMLTSMHFYSWSKGLKTGIYYLRRRAKHQAQQFTIEPEKAMLSQQDEEICEMCSS